MNTQHLSLEQKMGLKMSPRQVQLMRLLQVPSAELQDSIREEIENNPALEDDAEETSTAENANAEDDGLPEETASEGQDILEDYFNEDEFDSYRERSVEKEDKYERPAIERAGFQEQVLQQFRLLPATELQQSIGEIIIGNLDDDGYLARSVEAITNDLAFSQNIFVSSAQVEDVLKMVQTLEPAGVGARSLRECLLIQLERCYDGRAGGNSEGADSSYIYSELADGYDGRANEGGGHTDSSYGGVNDCSGWVDGYEGRTGKGSGHADSGMKIAKMIVASAARFDEFTSRKYDSLIKRFKISEQDFKNAVAIITSLNPRPGGSGEILTNNYSVIPDFIITAFENEITVSLNRDYEPNLRINPAYSQMLTDYSSDKKTSTFIKQKIENARSFIDLIKQRGTTLLSVMQTIVNLQRDYFLTGERSFLKPMILKDIAKKTELDISTISRITANKYAQTPYGIILLKDLFSQALQNKDGADVSSIEVKAALKKIVDNENHLKPLTDDALAAAMKNAGFPVSRRTITKYREMLNIPVARLRRGV